MAALVHETLQIDGWPTPNMEIKVLASLHMKRERRNELNLLCRWRK